MKIKKLLPSVYSLVFGIGMIAFSFFYNYNFSGEKFYKMAEGIPADFGVVNSAFGLTDATSAGTPFYRIKLDNCEKIFVLRMFGKNFEIENLDKLLSSGKKTGILFHDEKNEDGRYDIYRIVQEKKEIYSFNGHFSSASSGTVMWILLITGIVFVLFGVLSFSLRRKEAEISADKNDL